MSVLEKIERDLLTGAVSEEESKEHRMKKITEFEDFLQERLKKDLEALMEKRNQTLGELKEWEDLGRSIRVLMRRGELQHENEGEKERARVIHSVLRGEEEGNEKQGLKHDAGGEERLDLESVTLSVRSPLPSSSLLFSPARRLSTLLDLGGTEARQGVWVQAEIPDSTSILVELGLGFFGEFTQSEAASFVQVKIDKTKELVQKQTLQVAEVKAHIKIVIQGLAELMRMNE